ncbi:MAG: glycosyltransferase family 1 protein [Acidobacteriota bacterium]|nr:glycosyltransferase family 1 protein [Acidobacteriota bacterium]
MRPARRVAIDAINDNDRIRGPDRYLIGLLQGLAEHDRTSEYLVFYAPWQTFYERLALPPNFRKLLCRPPRHRLVRVLWHALAFPRIVARYRPDVVHLPNIIFVPFLSAPVVMTVHDLAHFRYPEKFGYFRGYTQRWLIRWSLPLARTLVAVSRFTRDDLRRYAHCAESRVRIIGEGGPAPKDVPKTSDHPPYFLYVGQLERSKNVESLIQAFAASQVLRDAGVELWIAGKPAGAASEITRLAQSLGGGRVRLLGYVDDARLPTLYGDSLAFVFPSLIEGFGLVLLEAMAYGAPVIASNASVIPEVVGDAGLLVDATDLAQLQQALERVYREPALRTQLIRKGRERLKDHSWHRAAGQTLRVYEELTP